MRRFVEFCCTNIYLNIPIECHEGRRALNKVSMGVIGADRQVPNEVFELRHNRRRVFVLRCLEPPGHDVV